MRRLKAKSIALICLVAIQFVGCSTTNVYEDVGEELLEEYGPTDSLFGHVGEWVKIGSETNNATDMEKREAANDSADCAVELQESSVQSPRTTRQSVATVQLLECMKSKGWSFVLIGTIILQH
jgi:hypothetical protein